MKEDVNFLQSYCEDRSPDRRTRAVENDRGGVDEPVKSQKVIDNKKLQYKTVTTFPFKYGKAELKAEVRFSVRSVR